MAEARRRCRAVLRSKAKTGVAYNASETILRDFLGGVRTFFPLVYGALVARARDSVRTLAGLFRFTFGGCARFESVEKLKIRSATGRSVARPSEAHSARILSRWHPKFGMAKRLRDDSCHWKSTSKVTNGYSTAPLMDSSSVLFASSASPRGVSTQIAS
jgi:hypothetical protein